MTEQQKLKTKATRIADDSVTFNKVIPAMLITLGVVTVLLVVASLAVILDIIPHG